MSELTKKELRAVEGFFSSFTKPVFTALAKDFGPSVFDDFTFTMNKVKKVDDLQSFKGSSFIAYKFDYSVKGSNYKMLLSFPIELIASVSDILMGGDGKNIKTNALTEVQINTQADLLANVFESVKQAFQELYNEELQFDSDPVLLAANKPQYQETFNDAGYDLSTLYSCSVNKENAYKIALIMNRDSLIGLLKQLKVIAPDVEVETVDYAHHIEQISDIKIRLSVELGKTQIPLKKALELGKGSIVELDTLANEDVKIYADEIEVARAQIVVVEDNFGIRITKMVPKEERSENK